MTIKYQVFSVEEAKAAGIAHPWCADWDGLWDPEQHYLYRYIDVDGAITEATFIACDGGEPEDSSFSRDWSWVEGELNAAYEQGVKDGKEADA